jgi:hypothetical protein
MESKIAKEAERALVEATQRLSPEERLNAYLEHCRLVTELYEAGQRMQGMGADVVLSLAVQQAKQLEHAFKAAEFFQIS